MVTVKVNGAANALVHKGGAFLSIATLPDVCKTPTPGGPVPIPYPNISRANSLSGGSRTVKADGKMIGIKGSKFSRSSGDEPGTLGGIKSGSFKKASTWLLYSFDVKIEGKNACRFSDKKFQNNENTVDAAGVIPLVVEVALDEVKMKCGELNQYKTQKKVSGGNKYDRDHVPSKEALKQKAAKLMKTCRKSLPKCVSDTIDKAALSIVIPKGVHQQFSPTYGQSAESARNDSKNLRKSARNDMQKVKKGLKGADPACVKAYEKAQKKITKITNRDYENWISKIIGSC